MSRFKGSVVVVTGAASGLGRQITLKMARKGASVAAWDLNREALENVCREVAAEGKGQAAAFVCDVGDKDQVREAAKATAEQLGPVEVLVNNAGVVSGKPFLELTDQDIERTMRVNTLGLFWTTKAFLPEMIKRNKGLLVTIASAAGTVGVSRLSDYCASKWAAIGLDESLRVELSKMGSGVKTLVICPYFINTGMFDGVKTRFPFLLPILEEEYATDRMVAAMEKGWRRLLMPPLVYTTPLLRLLPAPVFDFIAGMLGINASMDEFKGRKQ